MPFGCRWGRCRSRSRGGSADPGSWGASGVSSCGVRGEVAPVGIEGGATDDDDGKFAQDKFGSVRGAADEIAEVLA